MDNLVIVFIILSIIGLIGIFWTRYGQKSILSIPIRINSVVLPHNW